MNGVTAGHELAGGCPDSGMDPETRPFRELFLARLRRLATLRPHCDPDTLERQLVDHALYSTYWDCARLGLRGEAQRILGPRTDQHVVDCVPG